MKSIFPDIFHPTWSQKVIYQFAWLFYFSYIHETYEVFLEVFLDQLMYYSSLNDFLRAWPSCFRKAVGGRRALATEEPKTDLNESVGSEISSVSQGV